MRLFRLILLALGLIAAAPMLAWAQPDPAADDDDGDVDDEGGGEAPPGDDGDEGQDPDAKPEKSEAKPAKKRATRRTRSTKKATKKPTKKKADEDEDGEDGDEGDEPAADPKPEEPAAEAPKVLEETPVGGRPPINRRAASIDGPMGLDRVWSADTGNAGTFRLRFGLRSFSADDFPTQGSASTFTGTSFALAYTPIESLETWLRVTSTSNDNPDGRPSLLQTQGDIDLGLKGGVFVTPNIGLALAGGLRLVSGLGSSGFDLDGLSYELRALFTADFHRDDTAPVRVLVDVGFTGEGSEAVFANQAQEPDPIQEWGLQAYRYDRLMIGLGLEFPASEYVSPFLEYRIGTPFLVELSRRGRDSDEFDFNTVPHTIAGGVRAFPLEEMALDLVFRQGLSDNVFTGVAATPPWEIVFGLTYTLDPRPQIIERKVEAEAPKAVAEALSAVRGRVIDSATKKPIKGAIIEWRGSDLSPQVTDSDGRFEGYRFKPGKARLRVSAEGYIRSKTKKLTIKQGKDRKVTLKLKADPASLNGELSVEVKGPRGKPMGANVTVSDEKNTSGDSLPGAPFKATLKAGRYVLTVDTKGFKTIQRPISIEGGKPKAVTIPMQKGKGVIMLGLDGLPATAPAPLSGGRAGPVSTPRYTATPAASGGGGGGGGGASIKGNSIRTRGPIEFEGETARLTSKSRNTLNGVAALLKRNSGVKKVRVDAHTDGQGDAAQKRTLSIKRAQSVKSYLVSRGVARSRLATKGFGADKPIAPNMSARGRAQNNRIDLAILEMDK